MTVETHLFVQAARELHLISDDQATQLTRALNDCARTGVAESAATICLQLGLLSAEQVRVVAEAVDDASHARTLVASGDPAASTSAAPGLLRTQVGQSVSAQLGVDESVTIQPRDIDRQPISLDRNVESKYALHEVLGRGGMGEVWLAQDRDLRRDVAIKVVRRAGDDRRLQRFVAEAQITGQLEHPNIVPVHELGLDAAGETPFLVMKRVHGRSLADVIADLRAAKPTGFDDVASPAKPGGAPERVSVPTSSRERRAARASGTWASGRLARTRARTRAATTIEPAARRTVDESPQQALTRLLHAFLKVCEAMAYAHSCGVVHRDIKPENVMVGRFGEVLVMDWGLAKIIGHDEGADGDAAADVDPYADVPDIEAAAATVAGTIKGTPVYMAPEQATGDSTRIDERTDIYALGCLLYELLTLETAFDPDENIATVLKCVATGRFEPPRNCTHVAPWSIPRELDAVVMKAMATVRASRYQSVLELKGDIEAYLAGRTLAAADYSQWQRVSKWIARNRVLAVSGVVVTLLLVALTVTLALGRADAIELGNLARLEAEQAENARALADRRAEDAQRARDDAQRARDESEARRTEVEAALGVAYAVRALNEVEQFNPRTAIALLSGTPRTNRTRAAELLTPATWFVPAAFAAEPGGDIERVACDRNASIVATLNDKPPILHVYDRLTQTVLFERTFEGERACALAIDPRGFWVAVAVDHVIHILDTADGSLIRMLQGHTHAVWALAVDADGRRLASGGDDRRIFVWEAASGERSEPYTHHTHRVTALAFSPDGRTLATGSRDCFICAVSLATRSVSPFTGHRDDINAIAWDADGARLVSASEDNTVRIWDASDQRATAAWNLESRAMWVVWHPDDVVVAAAYDGYVHVLAASGHRLERAKLNAQPVRCLALSRDGLRLFNAGGDGSVREWALRDRSLAAWLPGGVPTRRTVCYSPSGEVLAAGVGGNVVLVACDGSQRTTVLNADMDQVRSIAFHPSGSRLAASGSDGAARIWELTATMPPTATAMSRITTTASGTADDIAWSPDGKQIAIATGNNVVILDADSRLEHLATYQLHNDDVNVVRYSPDGALIASGDEEGVVVWISAADGSELGRVQASAKDITCLDFSPDGRRIAVGTDARTVQVYAVATGRPVMDHMVFSGYTHAVQYSPDGRFLLVTSYDRRAHICDAATGVVYASFNITTTAAFSPDARRLAVATPDGAIRETGACVLSSAVAAERLTGLRRSDVDLVHTAPRLQELPRTWNTPDPRAAEGWRLYWRVVRAADTNAGSLRANEPNVQSLRGWRTTAGDVDMAQDVDALLNRVVEQ